MSFDLGALRAAVTAHGRVARVVVADVAGSTPREVGAAMLVWAENGRPGQSGTIGGGTLEFEAARHAFDRSGATRHALGPDMGQCCGGAVTLWTEVFDAAALQAFDGQEVIARGPGEMPLSVQRLLARARGSGLRPEPQLLAGWMVEPVTRAQRDIWIWGAGHVGRALVATLAPLPDIAITWVDTGRDRFPDVVPDGVTALPAPQPAPLMAHAPKQAEHLILTYSHALDLELCHAALSHGFGFCGLIGSKTKWARFRSRLANLGHSSDEIDRICCPIGQKALGKHPSAIAIGVAAQLLNQQKRNGDTCQTSFLASGA
ncbi:xanthine dehydrogenase accessory protein XdhC [Tropicibacter oceani]|uniref:Xanthine dehydrogenase accessory protein XdhC n=1 Tax=Tropicibacter oceani TaxID=3058420 RepID=A0ABY8QM24_9RHOB|nr:xanthine dehydrogenase accessory protein XdhC [Tropicibacter oceani]WGW05063.1 xanthine dehydrogenase accessory protein XdhC [Tropicibacter oceani]